MEEGTEKIWWMQEMDSANGRKSAVPGLAHSAILGILVIFIVCLPVLGYGQNGQERKALSLNEKPSFAVPQRLNLDQCINLALKYNRLRKASLASREIAEAQYKQALSAYWPQVNFTSTATRWKNSPNFVFPSGTLPLGAAAEPLAQSIAVGQLIKMGLVPGTPAFNAALPGATSAALQALKAANTPEQDVKLMDRDMLTTSLEMIYPLYTGGKRSAVTTQAKLGVESAKEASKRTDLQVMRDVKLLYYGTILSDRLLKLGQETLERFDVTLELTESLYKNGSGKVKKTDYLRTRVIVASIRSFVEQLKSNRELARSALVNVMGLDWHDKVEPLDTELPFRPFDGDIEKLVSNAHKWNSDMIQVKIGIQATEATVKEARSGHLPVLVFFGNLIRYENSYDAGLATENNKNNWTLGLRLNLPLFNGFKTTNEVKEAKARVEKIREESLLLKEGVALQVKDAFLQVGRAQAQVKATKDAVNAAVENRDLNVRAYNEELVETKDVIEAQLIELFINGQYLKALFDSTASQTDLEFIVGKGINDAAL